LPSLIHTHLPRQCSDPRDSVFALLGIANERHAATNPPDYALSVEEVAVRLLCSFTQRVTSSDSMQQLETICKSLVGRNRRFRSFQASGDSRVAISLHFPPAKTQMRTKILGVKVDSIAREDAAEQDRRMWLDANDKTVGRDSTSNESVRLKTRSRGFTICVKCQGDTELSRFYFQNEFNRFTNSHKARRSTTASNPDNSRWRWTVTTKGHRAIVPLAASPGDQICIFLGFPLPFVLRENSDDTVDVVGDCYAHGVMGGEVVHFEEGDQTAVTGKEGLWDWDCGFVRRQRRYGFSMSSSHNPTGEFPDHVQVATGFELQDFILSNWIPRLLR